MNNIDRLSKGTDKLIEDIIEEDKSREIYRASLNKPLPPEWSWWWENPEDDIYDEIYGEEFHGKI